MHRATPFVNDGNILILILIATYSLPVVPRYPTASGLLVTYLGSVGCRCVSCVYGLPSESVIPNPPARTGRISTPFSNVGKSLQEIV
jgi:hypothetical protein